MNPIAKMLIDMAKFYSYELEQRQLELYVEVMQKFPAELVYRAGREYVEDLKNTKFPIPPHSILKNYLPQEAGAKDLARITALRIREAVTKFGWPNPTEAHTFIGDAGWRVVERFGGWKYLCENLGLELNETTFIAQARDAVESDINLGKAGFDIERPVLEQAKDRGQLSSSADILKSLNIKQLGEKK